MNGPPGTEAELRAQQAGEHQSCDQLRGHDAQSKPQRSVRGGERDEGIAEAQMGKGIQNGSRHVEDDEHHCGQGQKSVHGLGEEHRPVRRCPARAEKDPENHDGGQEQQGHHAGAPGHVPEHTWIRSHQTVGITSRRRRRSAPNRSGRRGRLDQGAGVAASLTVTPRRRQTPDRWRSTQSLDQGCCWRRTERAPLWRRRRQMHTTCAVLSLGPDRGRAVRGARALGHTPRV